MLRVLPGSGVRVLSVGLLAALLLGRAGADATPPAGRKPSSGWQDFCVARLERARAEAARGDGVFARGEVVREGTAVEFKAADPRGAVYRAGAGEERAKRASAVTDWLDLTAAVDSVRPPDVHIGRQSGAFAGWVIASGPRAKEVFVSTFRHAVDDCLAVGGMPANAPATYAGSYAFHGDYLYDGCARQIVLYEGNILIAPDQKSMFADRLKRRYRTHVEDGLFIAENREPDRDCPGKFFTERWVLSHAENGTLRGRLETTWARSPKCGNPCDIDFKLWATRNRP
ncbi:MAG: hypothetical protein EXR72_11245 [Myxococcales bacterium]|nr:hypothetical protein [Myxococcales bacterium]